MIKLKVALIIIDFKNKQSLKLKFISRNDAFNVLQQDWGCQASHDLWEQALQLVEDCGLVSNITSPSAYVDNYLINGEFVSKEDNIEDWLHKTSHDGCFEQLNYEGDEYDQWLDDNFDMFWQEYCQENALIYNDEYACLSF